MRYAGYTTVEERFAGYFCETYGGRQDDLLGRADFCRLTDNWIVWTQVHGDFKDPAKRATFVPYPYWSELHACCRDAIKAFVELEELYYGTTTCARIMQSAMEILRKRHGLNAPKWWIPLKLQLSQQQRKKTPRMTSLICRRDCASDRKKSFNFQ